jgi:hypothetical protein
MTSSFTPRPLADREALPNLVVLSDNYFRVANEFRTMAATDRARWPGHFYIFPAITMYAAAFEAFLQEHLALSRFMIEDSEDAQKSIHIEHINALKAQQRSYQGFKEWVKAVFRLYDPKGIGVDTACEEYQNLLALKELRNSIVHYNPEFIEYSVWPARLEQALHHSKLEVMNAGWVTNFRQLAVADWAHDTVRAAVELFCGMTGAENPFTTTSADGTFNWEYVRPNPTLQPTPEDGAVEGER